MKLMKEYKRRNLRKEKKMKVGIPKGLIYFSYYPFINTFFTELGSEIILSKDTDKEILNLGIKNCVDEACLPVKIFHGHVEYLKDKCDFIFLPRIMQLNKNEFICPKFCGMPEMIKYNIKDLPPMLSYPLYAFNKRKLKAFIFKTGFKISKNYFKINRALNKAILTQNAFEASLKLQKNIKSRKRLYSRLKVALVGHPYNINDKFVNMNLLNKIEAFGIDVIIKENISTEVINKSSQDLFKRPFWTFAREIYGFAAFEATNNLVEGIIYLSSFSCGIDSVVIELIKNRLPDFPMLILKIDEQTGEAGFDTRLEAFCDMLHRKSMIKEGA